MFYLNTVLLALSFIYLFKINRDNYLTKINNRPCVTEITTNNEHDIEFAYFDDHDHFCVIGKKPKQPTNKSSNYKLPIENEDLHLLATQEVPTYTSYFKR